MVTVYSVLWIPESAAHISFLNSNIERDTQLFIDPIAIMSLKNPIWEAMKLEVQGYFHHLIGLMKEWKKWEALNLLSHLRESWTASAYTHIWYSKWGSWKAIWKDKAHMIYKSLIGSKALESWLLQDIEDTALLIEGIWKDNISDLITNILAEYLIKYSLREYISLGYTETMFIRLIVWNSRERKWTRVMREVPRIGNKPIILIPRVIVSNKMVNSTEDFVTHKLLPNEQRLHLIAQSPLCRLLKDWTLKEPTKKALRKELDLSKWAVILYIQDNPELYIEYKRRKI